MTAARATIGKERLKEAMARYHGRTNAPGLVAGAFDLAGYACCFFLLARYPWWPVAIPLALAQTIFIARLFVLGHRLMKTGEEYDPNFGLETAKAA